MFKRYVQDERMVLPSYEEMVPLNHSVRVVNSGRERIDIRALERSYKGGGTSSYHPRMLLKVIVYAYLRNVYSSRKIEQELCENVHFIWLSGGARPDRKTINDFRAKRLKEHLKKVFNQVVKLLADQGVPLLKELTLDGTKLEASTAGHYILNYTLGQTTSQRSYRELPGGAGEPDGGRRIRERGELRLSGRAGDHGVRQIQLLRQGTRR